MYLSRPISRMITCLVGFFVLASGQHVRAAQAKDEPASMEIEAPIIILKDGDPRAASPLSTADAYRARDETATAEFGKAWDYSFKPRAPIRPASPAVADLNKPSPKDPVFVSDTHWNKETTPALETYKAIAAGESYDDVSKVAFETTPPALIRVRFRSTPPHATIKWKQTIYGPTEQTLWMTWEMISDTTLVITGEQPCSARESLQQGWAIIDGLQEKLVSCVFHPGKPPKKH
jgi:hypothetical protein